MESSSERKPSRWRWLKWAQPVVIVYCLIGICFYHLQQKLLFHPVALPESYVYHFPVPFEELMVPVNDQYRLSVVKFLPTDSGVRKGIVLFFHGNRENINRYASEAGVFTRRGYEVWMPDYPGFGKTTDDFTEDHLYRDAAAVHLLAQQVCGKDSLVVYGESLGTGVAAWLASKHSCRLVLLQSPFYSMPSLGLHYLKVYPTGRMSKFKFPVYAYLKWVQAPVVFLYGLEDKDGLVPVSQAKKLEVLQKPGDRMIDVKQAGGIGKVLDKVL